MKITIEIGPSKTASWMGSQLKKAKFFAFNLPAKVKSGISRVNQVRKNSIARLRGPSAVS